MTHLCFADDILIFADGKKRSIEGVLKILDDFGIMSGLRISVEKSTLYLAGVTVRERHLIASQFPLAIGQLPVTYLGLPLLPRRMTVSDYAPLLERIRSRMCSWTARHLSYAGRMQLITSVISSITNFWMSAFRLPNGCIKEINKLCASFLWSGPALNPRKAKVMWTDVCRPKSEGGLGFKDLKEVNQVSGLKLIWRIVSAHHSPWVRWVKETLLGKESFWSIKETTTKGAWMWRKILKLRDTARNMQKIEVRNGKSTSFWFDHWSSLGRPYDVVGQRGIIDTGIGYSATMEKVFSHNRHRRQRAPYLINIEEEIQRLKRDRRVEPDIPLWRFKDNIFKNQFVTRNTRDLIRIHHPPQAWHKGVWFKHATTKYSFIVWLAMHNRLSTGDNMQRWNQVLNTTCTLCGVAEDTRDHLFFDCRTSRRIWRRIAHRLLRPHFTTSWTELTDLITSSRPRYHLFLIRYTFQASVYHLWRERNRRRHGESAMPTSTIIKTIEKNVRNRINSIRNQGDHGYADAMTLWLATHP